MDDREKKLERYIETRKIYKILGITMFMLFCFTLVVTGFDIIRFDILNFVILVGSGSVSLISMYLNKSIYTPKVKLLEAQLKLNSKHRL